MDGFKPKSEDLQTVQFAELVRASTKSALHKTITHMIHPSYISRFLLTNMTTVFHLEKLHDELWGPNILWYDVEEDGRVFKLGSFRFD